MCISQPHVWANHPNTDPANPPNPPFVRSNSRMFHLCLPRQPWFPPRRGSVPVRSAFLGTRTVQARRFGRREGRALSEARTGGAGGLGGLGRWSWGRTREAVTQQLSSGSMSRCGGRKLKAWGCLEGEEGCLEGVFRAKECTSATDGVLKKHRSPSGVTSF